MSETQRLRPGRPNPLRYQGGLRHYHVSPRRDEVPWEHWIGDSSKACRRWYWLTGAGFVVAIVAITAALWK